MYHGGDLIKRFGLGMNDDEPHFDVLACEHMVIGVRQL